MLLNLWLRQYLRNALHHIGRTDMKVIYRLPYTFRAWFFTYQICSCKEYGTLCSMYWFYHHILRLFGTTMSVSWLVGWMVGLLLVCLAYILKRVGSKTTMQWESSLLSNCTSYPFPCISNKSQWAPVATNSGDHLRGKLYRFSSFSGFFPKFLWPTTGCSLNIVFFPKILKYSGLCFPSVSVCVHKPGR